MEKDNGQWVTFQTGVQFYMQVKEKEDVFTDIQVAEDVTTVFFGTGTRRQQSYHLKHVDQRFPNVTTLAIRGNVRDLDISNAMFPNVQEVKSANSRFVTGPMLIQHRKYTFTSPSRRALLNAFEKNEKAMLDFMGVEEITDNALQGCKARTALHTDWLKRMSKHALDGSYFESAPYVRGCKFLGAFLLDIDETAEEVWIPDNLTNESPSVYKKLKQVKKLVVQSLSKSIRELFMVCHDIPDGIPDSLFVQTPERQSEVTNLDFLQAIKIKNIHVLESKAYSSKDGLLFDSTGEMLIHCPSGRTGTVSIPEGTKQIAYSAFSSCIYLEKIVCAQSLRKIGMMAFSGCPKLKEVVLNQGLEEIGDEAFFSCNSMQKLRFPGSIEKLEDNLCSNCLSLSEVVLEEGIRCIGSETFRDCKNLKTLTLPSSIQEIGKNSMLRVTDLYLKTDEVPDGLACAVCSMRNSSKMIAGNDSHICIHTPSETIYLPKYILFEWVRIFNRRPMIKDGYKYASYKADAIRTAFAFYQETKDQEAKAFIRKKSLLAIQFLSNKELVLYMQAGLLSDAALKKLQEKVAENPEGATEVQAYLLEKQKKKNRKPRQKFAL